MRDRRLQRERFQARRIDVLRPLDLLPRLVQLPLVERQLRENQPRLDRRLVDRQHLLRRLGGAIAALRPISALRDAEIRVHPLRVGLERRAERLDGILRVVLFEEQFAPAASGRSAPPRVPSPPDSRRADTTRSPDATRPALANARATRTRSSARPSGVNVRATSVNDAFESTARPSFCCSSASSSVDSPPGFAVDDAVNNFSASSYLPRAANARPRSASSAGDDRPRPRAPRSARRDRTGLRATRAPRRRPSIPSTFLPVVLRFRGRLRLGRGEQWLVAAAASRRRWRRAASAHSHVRRSREDSGERDRRHSG